MASVQAWVLEAELELVAGSDPAAVGAAVTSELCGHWEHEGPCRWPHNNAIDASTAPARFRTIVIAPAHELEIIHGRISRALQRAAHSVVELRERPPRATEGELADRLLAAPRLEAGAEAPGPD